MRAPATALAGAIWKTIISPVSGWVLTSSSTARGAGGAGSSSPSRRASQRAVPPCSAVLTSTTKKTRSKMPVAPATPSSTG